MLTIYTDGGNSAKNEIGACAAVICSDGSPPIKLVEVFNGPQVTNNTMELAGVLTGLWYVTGHPELGTEVTVVSDSEYVVKGASLWLPKWKLKQWKTTTGPVKNQPLWAEIDRLQQLLKITWQWCRGHDGNEYNEMADKLCVAAYQTALTDNKTGVSYQHDNAN